MRNNRLARFCEWLREAPILAALWLLGRLSQVSWPLLGLVAVLGACRPASAEEIPLGSHGSTYSVAVRLNDAITLNFLLDTGASDVALPGDVVSTRLRTGTLTERDFVGSATYLLADGSKLPSLRFILREVRVGSQSARNVVANVSPVKR